MNKTPDTTLPYLARFVSGSCWPALLGFLVVFAYTHIQMYASGYSGSPEFQHDPGGWAVFMPPALYGTFTGLFIIGINAILFIFVNPKSRWIAFFVGLLVLPVGVVGGIECGGIFVVATGLLLGGVGMACFVVVQMKAKAGWRLLSIALVLMLCCWSCSKHAKIMAYQEVQENYLRWGLREFVGDLGKLAAAGRTKEVAHACDRFQREFNIWYEGDALSNFRNLVIETSNAASGTNEPDAVTKPAGQPAAD